MNTMNVHTTLQMNYLNLEGCRVTRGLAKILALLESGNTDTTATSSSSVTVLTTVQESEAGQQETTRIRGHWFSVTKSQLSTRPHQQYYYGPPTAQGYIYSDRNTPRALPFLLKETELTYRRRDIPEVDIEDFLSVPDDGLIFHAFIPCHKKIFLAHGFSHPDFPLNARVNAIKDTDWRGTIVIFQVGTIKPLLSAPDVKEATLDKVVSVFVATVINAAATFAVAESEA